MGTTLHLVAHATLPQLTADYGELRHTRGRSAEALLQREQRVTPRAQLLVRQPAQGGRHGAVDAVHVRLGLVDIEEPRDDLAVALPGPNVLQRRAARAGIEVLRDLAQQHAAAVVHVDGQHFTFV